MKVYAEQAFLLYVKSKQLEIKLQVQASQVFCKGILLSLVSGALEKLDQIPHLFK